MSSSHSQRFLCLKLLNFISKFITLSLSSNSLAKCKEEQLCLKCFFPLSNCQKYSSYLGMDHGSFNGFTEDSQDSKHQFHFEPCYFQYAVLCVARASNLCVCFNGMIGAKDDSHFSIIVIAFSRTVSNRFGFDP